ncbi:ABC transporter ATP-binding protein [Stomatohabitans albus]|uniref:ABC transporter ATP-binding protein n=1 Tax=Stomatohabitans albus TaxID=3110766 RepID=UPI00300CFA6C
MQPVLDISQLTRRFKSVVANDGISFQIYPGQILGLLGHNGAGKTTLVSQIVGLLKPHAGSIVVAGVDAIAHPARARELTALQPQSQAPIDGLNPREAIEIAGRLYGLSPLEAKRDAHALMEALDITAWSRQRAFPEGKGLSGGVRRLTAFAMATIARTPLLILDEPTNDVDASRRRKLWNIVRKKADSGTAVLVVTHNVIEAERVVDDLIILDHGRVLVHDSPEVLRHKHGDHFRLELALRNSLEDPTANDQAIPFPIIHRVTVGRRAYLQFGAEEINTAIHWAQHQQGANTIDHFSIAPVGLEDVYIELTKRTAMTETEVPDVV